MKPLFSSDIMSELLPGIRTGKISLVTEGSTTVINTRLHMTYGDASHSANTAYDKLTQAVHPHIADGVNSTAIQDILSSSRVGIVIARSKSAHEYLNRNARLISYQRINHVSFTRYKNDRLNYNQDAVSDGRLFALEYSKVFNERSGYGDDNDLVSRIREDIDGAYERFGRLVVEKVDLELPIVDIFSISPSDETDFFDGSWYLNTFKDHVAMIVRAETGQGLFDYSRNDVTVEQIVELIDQTVYQFRRQRYFEWQMYTRDLYDTSSSLILPIIEAYNNANPGDAGSIITKTLQIRQAQQKIMVNLAEDPETQSSVFGPWDHEYRNRGIDRTAGDMTNFYVDVSFRLPSDDIDYFYMLTYSFFNQQQISHIGTRMTSINSDQEHLSRLMQLAFKNGSKDLIISDGQVGPQSYLLYDLNNVLYTGAYHKYGNNYRKGKLNDPITTPQGGILILKSVPNTKIQDFRFISADERYPDAYNFVKLTSFVNSYSYISDIVRKNMKNKLKILRDKRIANKLTNISMRAHHQAGNKVTGVIKIDQAEILSKNSLFGTLFDLSKPEDKLQFLWWGDMFSLLDVKILRKRVRQLKVGVSNNPIYVDFDPNEPVEVLISGGETAPPFDPLEVGDTVEYNQAIIGIRNNSIRTDSRFEHAYEYSDARDFAPGQRDIKARLRDANFLLDIFLTSDQIEDRYGILFYGPEGESDAIEYPTDPDNASRVLFPWVRQLVFDDNSFHGNSHKTGLYQYGIEVTYADGVAHRIYELYKSLVTGRSVVQRYKQLVFGATANGGTSSALINYDVKNDRVSDSIKNRISNSFRESIYQAVEAYDTAFQMINTFLIGGDPDSEAAAEKMLKDSRYSVILETNLDSSARALANAVFTQTRSEDFLTTSATGADIEAFCRSYDLILKTIEDLTSFSKMDASSSISERSSPNGKSLSTFTMSGFFEPEIGKGIVDMRNQNLLRASVLPHTEERSIDQGPIYDPEIIQGRLNNEFYKFGLIARDVDGNRLSAAATVEKLNELGFSGKLLDAPATLTIESVIGSSVWNFDHMEALNPATAMNSELFGLLDLVCSTSVFDRSGVENLQSKNKEELISKKSNVLEIANNAVPSGMSVFMSPATDYSPVSSPMGEARGKSSVKIFPTSVVPKSKKKKMKISFEAGEECNAYSQSTRRALIDHQRQNEHIERKLIAQALEKQLKASVHQATPISPSVMVETSNESDGATAESITLETVGSGGGGTRVGSAAGGSDVPGSPAGGGAASGGGAAPIPFSAKTIKDFKQKSSKADAPKALPLQLEAVESGVSNYGKIDDDKMSSTIFGNMMTINKIVGHDKNEKGTPNLKAEKLEPVSVSQVMSGLTPGLYAMVPYVNPSVGIIPNFQLPLVDSFFTVKSSSTSANMQPKTMSNTQSVAASSAGRLNTALGTANMMSLNASTSTNTTNNQSGGSSY